MKSKQFKSSALFICVFALTHCTDAKKHNAGEYPANHSAQNAHNATQPTAQNQQENDVDLKITQKIRQAVVGDDSLSMAGKNVKIITANGLVTLRGPVDSAQEKANIAAKAAHVAGVAKVDNQLDVKTQ